MNTATETEILPDEEVDTSEPDGKAHYVRIKAILAGGPVVALCGKKYVPRTVGPAVLDLPVCEPCANLYELLKSME